MKLLILCLVFGFVLCDYPRIQHRVHYPQHQFSKKWQQHRIRPHGPPRSNIPVHMPPKHKIQMGAGSAPRPVAVPVRNFFRSPPNIKKMPPQSTTFRAPIVIEKHRQYATSAPVLPTKVFQSSPAILAQEYDFQVQSNNVVPIKTIKQIGEKGPIHTIPAPNLSLADKPKIVEEVKPKAPEIDKHQYQVTEPSEVKYFYQNQQPNEVYHVLNQYQEDYLKFPSVQSGQNFIIEPEHQFAMDKSGNEEKDSTLVTSTYNLEPEVAESVVHSYFDDAKNDSENYFVSLPNKEAADILANLQAAGQINSNLNQKVTKAPVSIYVPEDDSNNYDDYQEDLITEEMKRGGDENFGHRLNAN